MTTENLIKDLGKPGRFQILVYFLLILNTPYIAWNHLGMAFIGAETEHHCRVKNKTDFRLVPRVKKHGKEQWDECHLYSGYNTSKKISCPNGWIYYLPDRESTVVAEWDMVCHDAYKTSLATTLYYCGVMLGTLVFGPLSDKFGRRPIFLVTMFAPSVIGTLLFFIENYFVFITLRFTLGFFMEGLEIVSFTSAIELLAIQYRNRAGVANGVFWSIGVITLALISFLVQDWRYIQLVTTVAGLLQIGMLCLLPESIRWLISKRRTDEAERVAKRISSFNNIPFPRKVFDQVLEECTVKKANDTGHKRNYTIIDVFRISVLRKRSVILAMLWFSTSLGYLGLALNVSSLAGNKYLNFGISGVFELVISGASVFILERFGRRRPLCFYSVVGGIACVLAGVLSKQASLQALTTALAICGRACMQGNFSVLYTYTSELYPTVIRVVGLGSAVFWATSGNIIAPQIVLLSKYTTDSLHFMTFGTCVFIAGILALMLPETLNMKLPETIEEDWKFEKMSAETSLHHEATPMNGSELEGVNYGAVEE